jgi:hypothetical protein
MQQYGCYKYRYNYVTLFIYIIRGMMEESGWREIVGWEIELLVMGGK